MKDRHVTFLVVPADDRRVRRLTLTYRQLRWLAAGACGLVVVAFAGLATYAGVAGRAAHVGLLERENRRLTAENAKVREIAAQLERTERTYARIRALAGLDELEIPAVSAGGAVLAEVETETRSDQEEATGTGKEEESAGAGWSDGEETDIAGEKSRPGVGVEAGGQPPGADDPAGWPLSVRGFVTARFGGSVRHTGIDIAAPRNTPVLATASGVVREAGRDSILGHYVIVSHRAGLETVYAHNERLLVQPGQRVERGESIARSGNSGVSTAPHLHYEVRRGGQSIDPEPYMR